MPSDILGTEMLEEDHGTGHRSFRFQPGPVFTNLLLADEINRTPPKTQAALLEAMQERTVSYAGMTHVLPDAVLRARDAEPDRAGRAPIRCPRRSSTASCSISASTIRRGRGARDPRRDHRRRGGPVPRVIDAAAVLDAAGAGPRRPCRGRPAELGDAARPRDPRPATGAPAAVRNFVRWGAGPRAGQSLILAAKARALLRGRLAATRDDVVALAAPVMRHRLLLSFAAEAEGRSADDVIARGRPQRAAAGRLRRRAWPPTSSRPMFAAASAVFACAPAVPSARPGSARTPAAAAARGSSSPSTAPTNPATSCAQVDWKLYARSDRFFVREAERESPLSRCGS